MTNILLKLYPEQSGLSFEAGVQTFRPVVINQNFTSGTILVDLLASFKTIMRNQSFALLIFCLLKHVLKLCEKS